MDNKNTFQRLQTCYCKSLRKPWFPHFSYSPDPVESHRLNAVMDVEFTSGKVWGWSVSWPSIEILLMKIYMQAFSTYKMWMERKCSYQAMTGAFNSDSFHNINGFHKIQLKLDL